MDLTNFQTTALQMLGVVLTVVVAWRLLEHYGKREWGHMITAFLAAVLPVWVIFDPNGFIAALKTAKQHIVG